MVIWLDGKAQYVLIKQADSTGDNAIEADNSELSDSKCNTTYKAYNF
ncbi:hypothetical protein ACOBV9_21475 (plasmid) [Pseudoalteromonas espejiana]